ncbi:MAG: hypothetical protein ISR52_08420 [Rhodospirillales bacterium]|nr:hypothetical protein [Rhodospirillales bacterium]
MADLTVQRGPNPYAAAAGRAKQAADADPRQTGADLETAGRVVTDEIDLSHGARLAAGLREGGAGEDLAERLKQATEDNERTLAKFRAGFSQIRDALKQFLARFSF